MGAVQEHDARGGVVSSARGHWQSQRPVRRPETKATPGAARATLVTQSFAEVLLGEAEGGEEGWCAGIADVDEVEAVVGVGAERGLSVGADGPEVVEGLGPDGEMETAEADGCAVRGESEELEAVAAAGAFGGRQRLGMVSGGGEEEVADECETVAVAVEAGEAGVTELPGGGQTEARDLAGHPVADAAAVGEGDDGLRLVGDGA